MQSRTGLQRLFLHASRLQTAHPKDQSPLVIEAPPPPELTSVLDHLRSLVR
jgi:hypothetical protein